MTPDDPRARRTRASLRAAALDLAGEKDPARLTLSAVATRAGVNRATVYLHYPDLDALLADAMEDAVTTLARATRRCPLDAPAGSAPAQLVELFTHVHAHAALYTRMLGPQGSARFAARLRDALTTALHERFQDRPAAGGAVPRTVHAAWLAGALVGVIAHCAEDRADDRSAPPTTTATAIWRLLAVPTP